MISEPTLAQIANLQLRSNRPLVICDVDEVVVHFTRDFEDFLDGLGLWLDTSMQPVQQQYPQPEDPDTPQLPRKSKKPWCNSSPNEPSICRP